MELAELEAALAGNEPAITAVRDLHGRAALVTDDVKADIARLPDLRKHSEVVTKLLGDWKSKDPDSLITDISNVKSVKEDLERRKNEWKAGGKPEESPQYLALKEELEATKTKIEGIETREREAGERATAAEAARLQTELKSSVTTAAGKLKANDPDDIYTLAVAKGLTGFNDDGKPFFNKLNDKGEKVAVKSAEEMVTWWSTIRKDLFAGSGVGGTGGKHKSAGEGGGDQVVDRKSAKSSFLKARGG